MKTYSRKFFYIHDQEPQTVNTSLDGFAQAVNQAAMTDQAGGVPRQACVLRMWRGSHAEKKVADFWLDKYLNYDLFAVPYSVPTFSF
jgi:hypothetical protein